MFKEYIYKIMNSFYSILFPVCEWFNEEPQLEQPELEEDFSEERLERLEGFIEERIERFVNDNNDEGYCSEEEDGEEDDDEDYRELIEGWIDEWMKDKPFSIDDVNELYK